MRLQNERELRNTRAKLQQLEELIQQAKAVSGPGRDTEIRSLVRLRDQLREEVRLFEMEIVSASKH